MRHMISPAFSSIGSILLAQPRETSDTFILLFIQKFIHPKWASRNWRLKTHLYSERRVTLWQMRGKRSVQHLLVWPSSEVVPLVATICRTRAALDLMGSKGQMCFSTTLRFSISKAESQAAQTCSVSFSYMCLFLCWFFFLFLCSV